MPKTKEQDSYITSRRMRDERTGEISYGYAATYAIHTDKAGNNPHAHILVANRHIDPKTGKWAAKRRTEYALDQNGERIPVIDPATGEQKTGAKNRKVWKRVDVSNNPLDSTEFLCLWSNKRVRRHHQI